MAYTKDLALFGVTIEDDLGRDLYEMAEASANLKRASVFRRRYPDLKRIIRESIVRNHLEGVDQSANALRPIRPASMYKRRWRSMRGVENGSGPISGPPLAPKGRRSRVLGGFELRFYHDHLARVTDVAIRWKGPKWLQAHFEGNYLLPSRPVGRIDDRAVEGLVDVLAEIETELLGIDPNEYEDD